MSTAFLSIGKQSHSTYTVRDRLRIATSVNVECWGGGRKGGVDEEEMMQHSASAATITSSAALLLRTPETYQTLSDAHTLLTRSFWAVNKEGIATCLPAFGP